MKRFTKFRAAVVALALGLATLTSKAAPLDDRVPGNALFYMGWAGAEALAPQYNTSNLKGILDASSIHKFVDTMLPKLMAEASRNDLNAPAQIAKIQAGLDIAWRHPVAVYFCPMDFTNPRYPIVRAGILVDAGPDAKKLVDLLTEALSNIPPERDPNQTNTFKVVEQGGTVLFTIGKPESLADLKTGGALNANASYTKAMGQVKTAAPASVMYVDVQKIIAHIEDSVTKIPDVPADVKARVGPIIDALGVRGITQAAVASGFENKGWSDKAFVGLTGPKTGVLALMDFGPLSDNALAVVPRDAVAFTANKLDLARVYNEVRTVVGKIEPRAVPQMDDAIRQVNSAVGFDINADFIAALGDEWTVYRAPLSDSGMGMALVSKLKDPDKFAKTLATIETLFNERSGAPIKVEKVKAGKTEVSAILFLTYNVCWTVHNGYLYVSTLDAMPGAIAQVDNKSPNITANPLYQNVMKMVPAGVKPTAIAYANPAKLYPELRTLVLGLIPLARGQGIDIPMDLLPDISAISEFMTPGGTVSWTDADGVHALGTSAFPGAAIMSGQGVSVPAVGAVALLPLGGVAGFRTAAMPRAQAQAGFRTAAMPRAQAQAVAVADMTDLRMIAQGCELYAADHNGAMPDHLGRLLLDGSISPRSFVNPRSGTPPLNMTPELEALSKSDFAAFAKQVDAHCDYIYIGKDVSLPKVTNPTILAIAYPKPEIADATGARGLSLAFLDGHVEVASWGNVAASLRPTVDYRAKNNLPPIDMDAINSRDSRSAARPAMIGPSPTANQLP